MKTAFAGRFLTLTMLAGLLTAFLPIPAEPARAETPPQGADQVLVEPQLGDMRNLDPAKEPILGDACGRHSEGTEIARFSAAPAPMTPGQTAASFGCSTRHCQPDAVFIGCCNRIRVSGIDSRGSCSVRQLCRDI
jgi:hypothetical protein